MSVLEQPSGYAIYCDDVRYEMGGKTTLVGVYENDLNIYADGPISIPFLHVVIKFRVPVSFSAKKLSLRVDRSDTKELLLDISHNVDEESDNFPELSGEKIALGISRNRTLNTVLTIQNMNVEREFYLRTRGYVDEMEVRLGSLIVRPVSGEMPKDPFT